MEIKRMWLVSSSLHIYETWAVYDEEKREFVYYKVVGDDYFYTVCKQDTFHNTEGAAVDYRNAKREEIKAMMPKVKGFIEYMEGIRPSKEFGFKRHDYLGEYADRKHYDYEDEYNEKCEMYNRLLLVARYGVMNIDGRTFKVSDISRIEWNEVGREENGEYNDYEAATVVLRDGTEIMTKGDVEYRIIQELFGENESHQVISVDD